MPKGPSKHAERMLQIETAAEKVRQSLRFFVNRQAALSKVGDEVANFRINLAPSSLRDMKVRNATAGLDDKDWAAFLRSYSGDVDFVVRTKAATAERNANSWRGTKPTVALTAQGAFIADDADLTRQPLAVLEAEKERLQALVAADKDIQNRLGPVSRKIVEETAALESLRERLKDCESSKGRAAELGGEREAGYVRVFEALLHEEQELKALYAPLKTQLTAAGGSLAILSFSVTRVADHAAWAKRGERDLFDLRTGPFKGIGSLEKAADEVLRSAWEEGSAADVAAAMQAFRKSTKAHFLKRPPLPRPIRPTIGHGPAASPNGCTAPITFRSVTASITTASTFASSHRNARSVRSYRPDPCRREGECWHHDGTHR